MSVGILIILLISGPPVVKRFMRYINHQDYNQQYLDLCGYLQFQQFIFTENVKSKAHSAKSLLNVVVLNTP